MTNPLVGVLMGSKSDWETMSHCVSTLEALGIECEARVLSAHRTPDEAVEYAETAEQRGLEVIIAAAGGAKLLETPVLLGNKKFGRRGHGGLSRAHSV